MAELSIPTFFVAKGTKIAIEGSTRAPHVVKTATRFNHIVELLQKSEKGFQFSGWAYDRHSHTITFLAPKAELKPKPTTLWIKMPDGIKSYCVKNPEVLAGKQVSAGSIFHIKGLGSFTCWNSYEGTITLSYDLH
jgi:hypothetical protein